MQTQKNWCPLAVGKSGLICVNARSVFRYNEGRSRARAVDLVQVQSCDVGAPVHLQGSTTPLLRREVAGTRKRR